MSGSWISRDVDDANFAHCVRMCGSILALMRALRIGEKIDQDTRNCIQIGGEVLEALLRDMPASSPLFPAAKDALDMFKQFTSVRMSKAREP